MQQLKSFRNTLAYIFQRQRLALTILAKCGYAQLSGCLKKRRPAQLPEVTVFISSYNTRYPLELTLRSLLEVTSYPNLRFLIAENNSQDGSREFLRQFSVSHPVEIIESEHPKRHDIWLTEVAATITTPYWIAVDSDMLFLTPDPIAEMINLLESQRDIYFLTVGVRAASTKPSPDPNVAVVWDGLAQAPCTYFFAVRTSVREHFAPQFLIGTHGQKDGEKTRIFYDTGAKFLQQLTTHKLRYKVMPRYFSWKFHHYGSLSWGRSKDDSNSYFLMKEYYFKDAQNRLSRYRA